MRLPLVRLFAENIPMTNPFADDPQSTPTHRILAEEDVRKKAVRTMRLSFRALAASLIGLALWLSLIGFIEEPIVRLTTPIFGPAMERLVVLFLASLGFVVMLLPMLALWRFDTRQTDVCPACGAYHAGQYAKILLHRICPSCREVILDLGSESEEEYRARHKKWGNVENFVHLAWLFLTAPTMDLVSRLVSPATIEHSPRSLLLAALASVILITGSWFFSRSRRVSLPFVLSLAYLALGIWIFWTH